MGYEAVRRFFVGRLDAGIKTHYGDLVVQCYVDPVGLENNPRRIELTGVMIILVQLGRCINIRIVVFAVHRAAELPFDWRWRLYLPWRRRGGHFGWRDPGRRNSGWRNFCRRGFRSRQRWLGVHPVRRRGRGN